MDRVERREVFFFPGYDIAGVKRYHRYLKRQSGWYARRFGVQIKVSDLLPTERDGWQTADVVAIWPDGSVQTRYHFCDWRGEVARDYAPSAPMRTLHMLKGLSRLIWRGQVKRIARAAPKFALIVGLPFHIEVLRLISVAIALWLATFGSGGIVAGLAFALGSFYGLKRFGDMSYSTFFTSYIAYLDRALYGGGEPDGGHLGAAIDALIAAPPTTDEIMIAGHSYGAAPAVVAAVGLAELGHEVSLLTTGSISPCLSLDPSDQQLRPALERLFEMPNICWRDYFAPQDGLCFPRMSPIDQFNLAQRGAVLANFSNRSAIYGRIYAARKLRKFRSNFLRMHFQFLMAVDVQGGFDWFRLSLGPKRLAKSAR